MFLLKRFRRPRDERAAALVTVVVLLALCFTAVTVVTATSIFGQTSTTANEAQLQALSAAEAGRDFALSKAPCVGPSPPSYSQASADVPAGSPKFTTTYYYWDTGSTPPATVPVGTASACPPTTVGGPQGYIGIVSVGEAANNGSSTVVTKRVLAWYPYTPGQLMPSSYVSMSPTISISSSPTVGGGVVGAIVEGAGGSSKVDLAGMQASGGPVYYNVTGVASGSSGLSCTGLTVGGDLILWSSTNAAVTVKCNGGSVGGTLYVSGNVTVQGGMTVGNVVSVNGSVTVGKKGVVTGAAWAKTTITSNGSVGTRNAGVVPAELPAVFSSGRYLWTDFAKANVPLTDTSHYQVKTVASCSGTWLTDAAENADRSTIIDATGCASADFKNASLALTQDLTVLLPPESDFQGGSVSSADGGAHEFNLIVPDSTPDHAPTCPSSGGTLKIDGFSMAAGVAADGSKLITGLAYTPCTMKAGGSQGGTAGNWQGQLFSGSFVGFQSTNHHIVYIPVTRVPGATSADGFGATVTTYTPVAISVPVTVPTTTSQSPVMQRSLLQQTEP